ncbi:hypothetical protein GQ55_4G108400 [Panicum hallii var. hallii]|uniref:DUF4408 domain-containing protein n=1 Tax=Panicum hallii var. hallii TaxID=1504633 RepID=A0A2T7DXE8_9POAL|nr:hypothetical protein GQ55_4G108400 [Panicum hallii var. hallii]
MLEEAIPALWSAVHGFFTPAVLFVVLNIVIGTIAVTSKVAAPAAGAAEEEGGAAGAGAEGEQYRKLSRVPSMAFDRLRSFNLSRFAAPAPEPAVAGEVVLGYEQTPEVAVEKEEPVVEPEPEPEPEREHEDAHAAVHMERSRSEAAAAAEAELPRLPARLHKSASDRSAFAHFEAEEVEEAVRAVEARRPATTREGARRAPVAEPEPEEAAEEAGGEVDALADAFINKFHHQLKLQRIESFIRHRETVRRGQPAAGAV